MEKHDHKQALVFDILMSLLGIAGTIGCFLHMFPLPISLPLFTGLMLVTSLFFLYLFTYPSNHKRKLLLFLLFYIGVAILTYSKWRPALLYILNTILRVYEANSQYSFKTFTVAIPIREMNSYLLPALWLLFSPLCACVIRSLRGRHSYFLAFLMSAMCILAILIFTLKPHTIFFDMVLVFWFSLCGMAYASRYDAHQVPSTITRLGLLFGVSACVVILGIQILSPDKAYVRDPSIESLRIKLQTDIRNRLTGEVNTETGTMDLMSARNRMYIGSNELRITMEEPDSLYLHGFSGTIYQDNAWTTLDENYFHRLYDFDRQSYLYPYNFVQRLSDMREIQVQKKSLTLTYLADAKQYLYTPYYALGDYRKEFTLATDAFIPLREDVSTDGEQGYVLIYADMSQVNKEELSRLAENTYYKMMKDAYLEVPEKLSSILSRMEIPELSQANDEKARIQAIQSYMQGFGSYTLTPGATPEDKDFITYFLTENKQGYCVHYASAAVMLLRTYGIPARYASGFRIHKEDFVGNSADIKDYHAHAWVEVLDPVLGWEPLEVTPASSTLPEQNPNTNQNPNIPNEDTENPQTPAQNQPQTPTEQTTATASGGFAWHPALWIPIGCMIMIVILVLRRTWIWRVRTRNMRQSDIRSAILSCGSYLAQLDHKEMPRDIEDLLLEAKFSNHTMTKEQQKQMLAYCEDVRIKKRKETTYIKHVVDKYLRCLD